MRALAVLLLLVAPAAASVAPPSLPALWDAADVVVIGVALRVHPGWLDGVAVAHVRVERAFGGAVGVGDVLSFRASPSWICDVATASAGERAVLFLARPHDDPQPDWLRAVAPRPPWTHEVAWSGRGRLVVDGDALVAFPDLRVPDAPR